MDSPVLLSQMFRRLGPFLFLLVAALFSCVSWVSATVTYDHKALVIDGQRKILMSGSIHYPRSTPQMWPDLIQKAKDGGLDVIETYVFWSGHEPSPGKYDFGDRFDLVRFIKLVQDAGLYVHLRIGPYACAEWNFGGFPVWLKSVPGIAFRTDNEPFKMAMQRFTEKIVKMMKQEKLFQPQGGPIILCQIENEYEIFEQRYGKPGRAYVNWAASMALNLSTGVPWVMCKQADAPGPVINTCNGFYCHDFLPNRNDKPKMWTELWTAWYSAFNRPVPHRSVEDIAFAVARFIQNNGSLVNYYMYHGGTNFGRTTGGPFVATSYDYDAPIDEYGLIRQPKWGHLQELHKAIKQCEGALVSVDPQVLNLGNNNKQEAHVFESDSAGCAAFLANYDAKASQKVAFREKFYMLPRWSVSILPDCKTEAFNTARVTAKSSQIKMNPVNIGAMSWQSYKEQIASALDLDAVPMTGLQEQISVTKDRSDYMWYLTTVKNDSHFLNGADPVLTIKSAGHGLHVFINGQLSGTVYGSTGHANITFQKSVQLIPGVNNISLLSVAVGLPNIGFKFETWPVGVLGPVTLGTEDLTTQKWYYKVGLKGEALSLYSPRAHWPKRSPSAENQPLMWYKTTFAAPDGNEPLAIDMNNMTKGQIWVNGNAIGRYWPSHTSGGSCGGPCNYAGTYSPGKCARSCGEDNRNHVPRSWLKKTGNTLVVFEETGGNSSGITFAKRTTVQESEHSTGQICGFSHLQTANKSCSK